MATKFSDINALLQYDFSIENSKKLITCILEVMGITSLSFIYTQNSLRKITDTTKKGMFVDDSQFVDFKAAYDITNSHYDSNIKHKQLILPRLFVIKQYSRSNIIWLNKLGINYEDDPLINGSKPLGLDFIVCQKRLLVVVSNQNNLRVLELNHGEELNSTQSEIISSWQNLFAQESNKKLLHSKLWDSLNLESVNKQFYIDIIQSFVNLKGHLTDNKLFENNQAVIFTNRLIGRLLFCYFLIKKEFIRADYLELNGQNDNDYYHKKLSQLFFAVLNTPINERSHEDITTPYLNGGLFERKDTDIESVTFPTNFFTNLFAIFRKYNWTVDESLSNYEVMAIDPEMLGRIFENLLAEINIDNDGSSESARKAKGAFYTPRVIVDYMCKESLRQYLKMNSPEYCHNIINRLLDDSISYLTDQKKNWADDIKPYKEQFISLLDKITVLDPACGSGAFPMGMLQLILQTYQLLGDKLKTSNRKIKIIESSIFGSDIEPNAIEIARLRAWLSIVVDQDKQDIEPLPNLDFKFVCCNSLIKLERHGQSNLADDMDTVEKLQELQQKYFRARLYKSKQEIRQNYRDLIEHSRRQNSLFGKSKYLEQIESYHPFDTKNICQFYDNQFMFGISDGFDVVIGNPPYVDYRKIPNDLKISLGAYNAYKETKTASLFVYFIELGINLLNNTGILCYINPINYLSMSNGYGIRKFIFRNSHLQKILDLSNIKLFGNADTYTCINIFFKVKPFNDLTIDIFDNITMSQNIINGLTNKTSVIKYADIVNYAVCISNSTKLLNKIMQLTIPLKNIAKIRCGTSKTGFSKKIVSKKTYQNLPISAMKNYIPILNSSDIGKYTFNEYKYIPITEFSCNSLNSFKDNRKLFMARMTLQVRVVANDENVSCGKVNVIYDISHEVNHLFLLGVLNSRLITYYYTEKHKNSHLSGGFLSFDTVTVGEIPIKLDSKYYTKISDLVLTAMINNNEDVLKKIDNLVYDLYDLTPEEISLIESK